MIPHHHQNPIEFYDILEITETECTCYQLGGTGFRTAVLFIFSDNKFCDLLQILSVVYPGCVNIVPCSLYYSD
jgi:hypothetical protein